MAEQAVLNGVKTPALPPAALTSNDVEQASDPGMDTKGFHWSAVDEKISKLARHPHEAKALAAVDLQEASLPPLGPIENFKGTFVSIVLPTVPEIQRAKYYRLGMAST